MITLTFIVIVTCFVILFNTIFAFLFKDDLKDNIKWDVNKDYNTKLLNSKIVRYGILIPPIAIFIILGNILIRAFKFILKEFHEYLFK